MLSRLIIFLFITIPLYGCQSTLTHKSYNKSESPHEVQNTPIWVSNEYVAMEKQHEEVSIFVRYLRIPKHNPDAEEPQYIIKNHVPDYYLIVNNAANENKLRMLELNHEGRFSIIGLDSEKINGKDFKTQTILFNTIFKEKGGYYELISNSPYSPPECGILKHYVSSSEQLTITLVNDVSSGQLHLESKNFKSNSKFKDRVEALKVLATQSFGVIN